LKDSALPNRPWLDHVAPAIVPVLLFPDTSVRVAPDPALKSYAATSPVPVDGEKGADACEANAAMTVVAAVRASVQVPVPLHPPPLQPVKVEPDAGVRFRVTTVPLGKFPEQLAPQLIPAGVLVIVPVPVPLGTTARPTPDCTAPQAVFE